MLLKALGYRHWKTPAVQRRLQKAKHLYTHDNMSIGKLAKLMGVHRTCVQRWAKRFGWKRVERTLAIRTQYRRAAERMLGRRLRLYETVHHVDLDTANNADSNLFVYRDAAAHSNGHTSLERCALAFLKSGLISFDRQTGVYKLA